MTEGSGAFSSPRPNLIESDKGFSVEVLGRTGLRYVENGRAMFIDSEVLTTPGSMAVYRGSIQTWDPPHESDAVAANDQERILSNIREAFDFKGYTIRVI
jgi:hypothetical protein